MRILSFLSLGECYSLADFARFVHRLDYPTSGALCVATSSKYSRWACKAFERRHVTKHYLALVCGKLHRFVLFTLDTDGQNPLSRKLSKLTTAIGSMSFTLIYLGVVRSEAWYPRRLLVESS